SHPGTPPSGRPRACGVRFASFSAGPAAPPFRPLVRVGDGRLARPASCRSCRSLLRRLKVAASPRRGWFFPDRPQATPGGRSGKRAAAEAAGTRRFALVPPSAPGGGTGRVKEKGIAAGIPLPLVAERRS